MCVRACEQKRIKGAFDPLSQFLLDWALEDDSKLVANIHRAFLHMDMDGQELVREAL
jgi:hypothetical protein